MKNEDNDFPSNPTCISPENSDFTVDLNSNFMDSAKFRGLNCKTEFEAIILLTYNFL